VLLIGPSPVFLRYIEHVLPSLGEQDVQLSTIAGLKPRLRVSGTDSREVAALKGDVRMAQLIANAVADRERPVPQDLVLLVDGLRVQVSRGDTMRVIEGARRRRATHNESRPYVVRRLVDLLVARYKAAAVRAYNERRESAAPANVTSMFERGATLDATIAGALARGESPPEGWEPELRARLRGRPEVREAFERMWPALSGPELVNDLFGFNALVTSAAQGLLSESEQRALHRRRERDLRQVAWTEADVPLVDEADTLLGPVEAARPRRRRARGGDDAIDTAARVIDDLGLHGYANAATLASRFGEGGGDAAEALNEPRTFGHLLVDEAQDLTAMQWRMLARRCPSGSMTLVGDPGQASRPGAVASWDDVLVHVPTHNAPRYVTLTINYRTPAEVMDVASRLLSVAAPAVEPSISVRSTGEEPRFIASAHDSLITTAAQLARDAYERTGTIAVIAPSAMHAALVDSLVDLGAVAETADALDAPVAVLEATSAKGLEFDHVIVVEPSELVTADRPGLRLLYVTITRATKSLTVVHADALPEGLTAPG
jgi:hypothetical protein